MQPLVTELTEQTKSLTLALEQEDWPAVNNIQNQRARTVDAIQHAVNNEPGAFKEEDFTRLSALRAQEDALLQLLTTGQDALKTTRRNLTKGKAMIQAYSK